MVSLLAATWVGAADVEAPILTLEQAMVIAEQGNHHLLVAGAQVDNAEAEVDAARSLRLPQLDFEAGFQHTDNPTAVFSNLLAQESFGPENFDIERLNQPDPLDHWNARLMLVQPLWTGGLLTAGERAARQQKEATVAARERAIQEVRRQVAVRYTSAVIAGHELNVARDSLATAEAHVRLVGDLHRGGLVVESDVLSAQVRTAEVREMVIRAESEIWISHAALNLAMGRDQATPIRLPENLELNDSPELNLDQLIARARDQRPDLRAAEHLLAAAGSRVAMAQSSRRPQVALNAGYETAAEDFFGNDGDNWSVGVGLRLPLFDGFGSRARIGRAQAQADASAAQVDLAQETAALEVRRAFYALEAARQRLQPAGTGVRMATRSLEIVTDRYKEGLANLTELLDAEAALTESRRREVAARRDVLLATTDLNLATGDL